MDEYELHKFTEGWDSDNTKKHEYVLDDMRRCSLWRGWKYLKSNDAKNTFILPMTSPGKLNEVEYKITRGKKPGKKR